MSVTKVSNLLKGPLNFVNGAKIAGSGKATKIFDPAKGEVSLRVNPTFKFYLFPISLYNLYDSSDNKIKKFQRLSENLLEQQKKILKAL